MECKRCGEVTDKRRDELNETIKYTCDCGYMKTVFLRDKEDVNTPEIGVI